MSIQDPVKGLSKSLIEATRLIMEKAHTVPKTEKEKKLAAMAEPKDKITHADVLKGRGVMKEAEVDGVAAGSMEGDKHMCATKVFHKEWAEGTPVKTMHADPDENGLIEWYDVMFEHGIERVMTEDMEILQAESHMHSKKKMKEETIAELSKGMKDRYKKAAQRDLDSAQDFKSELEHEGEPKDSRVSKGVDRIIKNRKMGMKRANEEVQIDEAMAAGDRFKHHHEHAKALLKSIGDHLKTEHEAASKFKDYRGNKGPSWGHVGSMEHIANQLSNIHDMLARKGEYAESVEVEDEVTLSEEEIQALEAIAEEIEELDEISADTAINAFAKRTAKIHKKDKFTNDTANQYRKKNATRGRLVRKFGTDALIKANNLADKIVYNREEVELDELEEARGRPKLPRDAKGNIIRSGAKQSAAKAADEEPAALGYQLRKAASINKPVHFMNNEKKHVTSAHTAAFNDHMAARKTSAEKAAFQKQAHKSHADFIKAVSAPVPKAVKDTGEIIKYRH